MGAGTPPPAPATNGCLEPAPASAASDAEAAPVRIDVDAEVREENADVARRGIEAMHAYLVGCLGRDVPDAWRDASRARIVASYPGSVVEAVPLDGGTVMTINTGHAQWNRIPKDLDPTGGRVQFAASTYAATFLQALGCGMPTAQENIHWLSIGAEAYLSYQATIADGALDLDGARQFLWTAAAKANTLDNLAGHEGRSQLWPGHVGYFAVERLMDTAPDGAVSLATYCESVGEGMAAADAFEAAFDLELQEFYTAFDAWRTGTESA